MIAPFFSGLREMGVDVDALAERFGLRPESLRDPHTRVPYESVAEFVVAAIDVTGDAALGLHLSERYRPGAFGILDYLALSSRTLGDALRQLCRYGRLLADAAETLVEDRGDRVFVWQRTHGGFWRPSVLVENAMAHLVVIARRLTGRQLAPVEVHFAHPEPAYSSEHARIFRAPVRFFADRDGLLMSADVLRIPLVTADSNLLAVLQRHADHLLAQAPAFESFAQRVRETVLRQLKAGAPTADEVAGQFKMSKRTLSRRLHTEGASYETIRDGLRRDLSKHYLHDDRLSIDDVALLLGYAEMNAFRRAFQRWHGITPAVFRRETRSTAEPTARLASTPVRGLEQESFERSVQRMDAIQVRNVDCPADRVRAWPEMITELAQGVQDKSEPVGKSAASERVDGAFRSAVLREGRTGSGIRGGPVPPEDEETTQ
jgi:AraC-like DNA-binding protein